MEIGIARWLLRTDPIEDPTFSQASTNAAIYTLVHLLDWSFEKSRSWADNIPRGDRAIDERLDTFRTFHQILKPVWEEMKANPRSEPWDQLRDEIGEDYFADPEMTAVEEEKLRLRGAFDLLVARIATKFPYESFETLPEWILELYKRYPAIEALALRPGPLPHPYLVRMRKNSDFYTYWADRPRVLQADYRALLRRYPMAPNAENCFLQLVLVLEWRLAAQPEIVTQYATGWELTGRRYGPSKDILYRETDKLLSRLLDAAFDFGYTPIYWYDLVKATKAEILPGDKVWETLL